jgi:hypothetical protein
MEPTESPQEHSGESPPRESGDEQPQTDDRRAFSYDTLRNLEERLDRASDAAERLIAEAVGNRGSKPPPAGWQAPPQNGAAGDDPDGDLEHLATLMHVLQDLIPADLQRRLGEALREVLLALRALLDWYIERLQHRRGDPPEVQDIPIL